MPKEGPKRAPKELQEGTKRALGQTNRRRGVAMSSKEHAKQKKDNIKENKRTENNMNTLQAFGLRAAGEMLPSVFRFYSKTYCKEILFLFRGTELP